MTDDQRPVHTGWGRHESLPDTFRIYAECAEEMTEIVMVKPSAEMMAAYLLDEEAAATSPVYQALIAEHVERCESCRLWQEGPVH